MVATTSAGKRAYYTGKAFLSPWGSNSYEFLGDVSALTLSGTETLAEGFDNTKPTKPKDEIIAVGEMVRASMTLMEITAENAAIALRASLTTIATGSVTSESHTAPAVGRYFSLDNPLISAVTSITSDPSGTTFVVDDDYVLELPSSMIYVPTGSALAGDPILVNYTKAAATQVKAFKTTVNYYALKFVGYNSSNQGNVVVDVFKIRFSPAQVNELLSQGNTLKSYQLEGESLFDSTLNGFYNESVTTPA